MTAGRKHLERITVDVDELGLREELSDERDTCSMDRALEEQPREAIPARAAANVPLHSAQRELATKIEESLAPNVLRGSDLICTYAWSSIGWVESDQMPQLALRTHEVECEVEGVSPT